MSSMHCVAEKSAEVSMLISKLQPSCLVIPFCTSSCNTEVQSALSPTIPRWFSCFGAWHLCADPTITPLELGTDSCLTFLSLFSRFTPLLLPPCLCHPQSQGPGCSCCKSTQYCIPCRQTSLHLSQIQIWRRSLKE